MQSHWHCVGSHEPLHLLPVPDVQPVDTVVSQFACVLSPSVGQRHVHDAGSGLVCLSPAVGGHLMHLSALDAPVHLTESALQAQHSVAVLAVESEQVGQGLQHILKFFELPSP